MITITPNNQSYQPPPVGNMGMTAPGGHRFAPPHHNQQRFNPRNNFFKPFTPYIRGIAALDPEFDGKRLRKSAMRKTVDYNSAIIKMLEARVWQRDFRDRRALQPDVTFLPELQPPPAYEDNAINAVTTRFVKAATNKMRCPIFCMAWTPEGRRLVTGASSGEFTLWNGLTFNFETILQAHDTPVRTMQWSHNDVWMVTADHAGYVKYWQSNMNNVKMFMAHKEAIRGISFSPNDSKFATCSDDGTVRIWDFQRCAEERILRGHGADVKCVHWHPHKGLVISGSKDNQQPIKLWDPKTGQSLATLHAHKSTVMDIKWNNNGNWVITASRDHLLKLFDVRNLSTEVQTFRGHKKESSSVAWHPYHEGLFCSGGSDGAILFWHVGADKEVGAIEQAHDSIVWTLAWHPLGHILCSGSNDHSSKFWTRNRPGDLMRDKYNLNTLPANMAGMDENDIDDLSVIPGMGPEDKVEAINPASENPGIIPGLDLDSTEDKSKAIVKKVPYSKPIPKNFQAHWNHAAVGDDDKDGFDPIELINQLIVNQPGVIPLADIEPESLVIFGKQIDLKPEDELTLAIKKGYEAFVRYINSGAVEELNDVRPYIDFSDDDKLDNKTDLGLDIDNFIQDDMETESQSEDTQQSHSSTLGFHDQDMRQMMMQPPSSFLGLNEGRHSQPPPPLPQQRSEDSFHSNFEQDNFRPNVEQGNFRPNLGSDNYRSGFRPNPSNPGQNRDFRSNRDFNQTPDRFQRGHKDDFDDTNNTHIQRNSKDNFDGMNNFRKDSFGSDFDMRPRGGRTQQSFRGRNQSFVNDHEETRSSFNQQEDQDMRGYNNGGYNEEENENDGWNKDERFRDWDEEGMGDEENTEEDYQPEDRRPYQPYSKQFPSRPSRGRGSPRTRGFERGRRMRGRGRGASGRGGGFRSRGRNPRR